jgi:hypothetical protein
MLGEIFVDELTKRQRPRHTLLTPQPLERPLQGLARIPLRGEPALLDPPRATTGDSARESEEWLARRWGER